MSLLSKSNKKTNHEALQNYIAVKVLRQFSDRVKDALLYDPSTITTWMSIHEIGSKISPSSVEINETRTNKGDPGGGVENGRLKVIEEVAAKNRRNDTKFNILIIQDALKEVYELSPLARQQIAWSYKLDYKIVSKKNIEHEEVDVVDNEYSNNCDDDVCSQMAYKILETLLLKVKSQKDLGPLKLDTSPKSVAPLICKHLQNHARNRAKQELYDYEPIEIGDPFSGPLDFTLSTTQANYILNIIEAIEGKEYYFGVVTKEQYHHEIGSKLNDNAAKEVWIEPTDSLTGNDLNILSKKKLIAPVSRAYYKLSQVFDDYSKSAYFFIPKTGCGMDVGSSPGGWTQVLHTETNASQILSIDPAILAHRVEKLNNVIHCKKDFTSDSAIDDMVNMAPFSYIVCDASTSAVEVFTKLISTFDKVHEKLIRQESNKKFLASPSTIVITIKMPYNREKVKKKMLMELDTKMPSQVSSMIKWSGSKKAMYKVVHNMANSVTERTVIILLR